jgi:hypothetical protein
MKHRILSLSVIALAMTAGSVAFADAHISVAINPFGWWGPPPPVVYAPPRYYAPPVVYYGHDHWGDHRDARGHHDDRGHSEHHDGGDGRH